VLGDTKSFSKWNIRVPFLNSHHTDHLFFPKAAAVTSLTIAHIKIEPILYYFDAPPPQSFYFSARHFNSTLRLIGLRQHHLNTHEPQRIPSSARKFNFDLGSGK
jgi:hypothetical protein